MLSSFHTTFKSFPPFFSSALKSHSNLPVLQPSQQSTTNHINQPPPVRYLTCYNTAKFTLPEQSSNHRYLNKWKLVPQYLLQSSILKPHQDKLVDAPPIALSEVKRVHCSEFVDRFLEGNMTEKEMRRIGFSHSPQFVQRVVHVVGGTFASSYDAMNNGKSAVLAGGAHHAFYNEGSGFCVWNDLVIAGESLVSNGLIKSYLIIDLDVHQGDGTAAMCANIPHAYTFSMHGKKNFPLKKQQSSWDIPLEDYCEDGEYLEKLRNALKEFKNRRRHLLDYDFVFYQAGVDPLKNDKFGRLNLSMEGLKERDRLVCEFVTDQSVPICVTLGGGYPDMKTQDSLEQVVQAHCNTIDMLKTYCKV